MHRFVTLIGLLAVTGCASLTGVQPAPEEVVAERAQERMDALVAGDYERVYGFETPGFRETVSLEDYLDERSGRITYADGRVREVRCEQTVCVAEVAVSYRFRSVRGRASVAEPVTRISEQRWVQSGDQWWHFRKN